MHNLRLVLKLLLGGFVPFRRPAPARVGWEALGTAPGDAGAMPARGRPNHAHQIEKLRMLAERATGAAARGAGHV